MRHFSVLLQLQLFAQLAQHMVADAVIGTHLVAEEPRARACRHWRSMEPDAASMGEAESEVSFRLADLSPLSETASTVFYVDSLIDQDLIDGSITP